MERFECVSSLMHAAVANEKFFFFKLFPFKLDLRESKTAINITLQC